MEGPGFSPSRPSICRRMLFSGPRSTRRCAGTGNGIRKDSSSFQKIVCTVWSGSAG